ncbi:GNAT family N-acetyltransferase [Bradyrhizobium prioriisuperbiae]|uniref:GNAT family N-acetyltransferase n=1 Tax=Bradyrhizobium prioriisuperbiae TaxID=2854389 RepID=UPI0028E69966|nr:GNAT family N-acetyltransferase [Bradyrhizobium prioritasuperba]
MLIEIRQIEPRDVDGFYAVLDAVARERRYLAFLEAPPIEAARVFVENNLKRGYPHLIALSDEQVVGWCDITPMNRPIYGHCGVLGMGLLPAFRGQRVGTRLVRAALADARRIGLHRVELTVRETNASAISLYKAMEFKIEGVKRDGVQIDGRYENLLMMAVLF